MFLLAFIDQIPCVIQIRLTRPDALASGSSMSPPESRLAQIRRRLYRWRVRPDTLVAHAARFAQFDLSIAFHRLSFYYPCRASPCLAQPHQATPSHEVFHV